VECSISTCLPKAPAPSEIGVVYLTTNTITGNLYLGSTNTNKPTYLGSGRGIATAIKQYGRQAFTRVDLYRGVRYREVEVYLLRLLDLANNPLFYNVANIGIGGPLVGSQNGMYGKHHSATAKEAISKALSGRSRPDHANKIRGSNNGRYQHGRRTPTYVAAEQERLAAIRLATGKKHVRIEVTCPTCGKVGSGPNMTRYHFDKCKHQHQ
jgi:hypothetical protein